MSYHFNTCQNIADQKINCTVICQKYTEKFGKEFNKTTINYLCKNVLFYIVIP